MSVIEDAKYIIDNSINDVLPDTACIRALESREFSDRVVVIAIGKAAFTMAKAACEYLGDKLKQGIIITKYEHVRGKLHGFECYEAGHPILDHNSVVATERVLELIASLDEEDEVLFLVSGGGSSLFEAPLISLEELQDINKQLLECGASIEEINTIRKRLSKVKGGKFAQLVAPHPLHTVVLSDVIGDPLDMIASGPSYPDTSSCEDALSIVKKYNLNLSDSALEALKRETPKDLRNLNIQVVGSVKQFCESASRHAKELGFTPIVLTDCLECEASEAGRFLGCIAKAHALSTENVAIIAGGETTVKITGDGLGGRNQELALAGSAVIDGIDNCCLVSVGSDGTDGPTDAAGGIVTGETQTLLRELGIDVAQVLADNDSYHALQKVDGLYMTGPTGTNVNDLSMVLIKR